jgi:hypothetical protein
MTLTWYPDFCPSGQCQIEIEPDWSGPRRFVKTCAHHQSLRNAHGDQGAFSAILQSSRVKETARWEAKQELMSRGTVNKEFPGVPYVVNADGSFTLQPGGNNTVKNAIRTRITTALALIDKPTGTSTVSVA